MHWGREDLSIFVIFDQKIWYVYCLHLWSVLYLGRQKLNPLLHNTKIMICILSSEILIYHLWHKQPEVILLMYHPQHLQYFQLLSISIRVFSTDKNKMNSTVIHLYYDGNFLNIILFWNAEIFFHYLSRKSFSHFVSPPFHLCPKIRNKSSQIFFFNFTLNLFEPKLGSESKYHTGPCFVRVVSPTEKIFIGADLTKELK